jgi:hypothetical protein
VINDLSPRKPLNNAIRNDRYVFRTERSSSSFYPIAARNSSTVVGLDETERTPCYAFIEKASTTFRLG